MTSVGWFLLSSRINNRLAPMIKPMIKPLHRVSTETPPVFNTAQNNKGFVLQKLSNSHQNKLEPQRNGIVWPRWLDTSIQTRCMEPTCPNEGYCFTIGYSDWLECLDYCLKGLNVRKFLWDLLHKIEVGNGWQTLRFSIDKCKLFLNLRFECSIYWRLSSDIGESS